MPDITTYLIDLRQQIAQAYIREELQELVFELGLDWDELPGEIKSRKIQAIILTLVKRGRLELLIAQLRKDRSQVLWPDAPPPAHQRQFLKSTPVGAAVAVGAAAAGIGYIDGLGDDLIYFLSQAPNPIPTQHRLMFGGNEGELVAHWQGQPGQRITAEDLANLPADELRHISVLEASMEGHYARWEKLYPQRGSYDDPEANAEVERQLQELVANMADDLTGILSFLELMGFHLDDHYLRYRHLVNQVRRQ